MMSRLAIKIFCWLWLAFILLLVGFTLAIDQWGQNTAPQALGEVQMRQWQQTQERLSYIFQTHGLAGVKRFARDLRGNRGIEFYVLDNDSHELLGQALPPTLQDYFLKQRGASEPLMQRREQRLVLGPGPFPAATLPGQVLLWLPVGRAAPPPVSGLWRGPHAGTRLVIALAVSGMVSLLLAISITRPLRRLQAAAQGLANGNFDTADIDRAARRRDEIGDLAREFRTMATRLKTSIEGRQRLLRDISHELRSPLARLQVAIELADRQAGPDNSLGFERMETECQRLNTMIGDVLTLARAEQEEASIPRHPFDLVATLHTLIADARFEGQAKHIRIELRAPEHCLYNGNENLIASAVENILRNAARYTPPASTITVTLQIQKTVLSLSIGDAGPGVPEQELAKIFDPFYRVSEARERDGGGTGIGLAIAMRTAQCHGGGLIARNRSGGGLEVVMTLALH